MIILIVRFDVVISRFPYLAVAGEEVTGCGDLAQSHGAAGAELLGRDAYFGAEPELGAVGERGGQVDVHAGGVDTLPEQVGCLV